MAFNNFCGDFDSGSLIGSESDSKCGVWIGSQNEEPLVDSMSDSGSGNFSDWVTADGFAGIVSCSGGFPESKNWSFNCEQSTRTSFSNGYIFEFRLKRVSKRCFSN